MNLSKSKKTIAVICAIAVAIVGCCTALMYYAVNIYKVEKALKEKNSISEITDAFHDQGDIYMTPAAPTAKDDITVRLRSDRYNVTKAQVQYTLDNGVNWKSIDMDYEKRDNTGYYDLWKAKIPAQSKPFFYRFAVANDGSNPTMYYGVMGIKSYQIDVDEMFYVIPGFTTPKWSQGTMWYYAHTAQFFNADTTNDTHREFLMYDGVYGNDTVSMHRGSGDFKGIQAKLDYISGLGAEVLALGPFYSSSSMYGFGVDNYGAVESAFGNENDIIDLINDVHKRNMKITTDMIISYSAYDSKYFNMTKAFPTQGAYQSENSKYYSLFKFPQWPSNFVKIWGSPGIDAENSKAQEILYKANDSIVLKYLNKPYGLDGYRFDAEESVGNLGYDYDYKSIWNSIRASLKGVSKDVLMLSENCAGIADQYNTLFDSSWQKNGYFAMKAWFEGSNTASQVIETLQKNLVNTARPRALSSYNFLGQHDVTRLWDDTEKQRDAISALLLLQMTYLGSPVVYYGDEIGLTNGLYDNQTASPFNWDESSWDYNILNLIKSLGKLRKEYSCLRDGVVRIGDIEDSELFLSFGRFDKKGSVITLCNQQNSCVNKELNVSQFNVKDGAVLTDYLTGNQYKVKDGKISIVVIPGGTVLVTGNDVSDYRGEYQILDIGGKLNVVKNDTASFTLSGKGKINGDKDSINLLSKDIYNNSIVSAKIVPDGNSTALLTIRNSADKSSACYAVEVSGGKLTVKARTDDKGKVKTIVSSEIPNNSFVKIIRENGNSFSAYYTDDISKAYKKVEKSTVTINGKESMIAGISVISGEAKFENVVCEASAAQIFDSFDGKVVGSMFENTAKVNLKNGNAILDSKENKPNFLLTNAHSSDFTFKTEITDCKLNGNNNTAGVVSYFSDNNYVYAGRTVVDGKNYFVLARMQNGKPVIKQRTEDKYPDKSVVIQLQRIGNMYSAVYSYDSKKYESIGYDLYCNYTGMKCGILTLCGTASFDYATFGNAVNDNETVNTPISLQSFTNGYAYDTVNVEADMLKFVGGDQTWKDIGSGYEQNDTKGLHLLLCQNKVFDDVRAEATVSCDDAGGTVGVIVSKKTASCVDSDGYKVALFKSGDVKLYCGNKELANAKVKLKNGKTRLVVQRDNGYIHIFAGEKADLVISVYDTTFGNGFVSFYTDKTSGIIDNPEISPLHQEWGRSTSAFGTDNYIELPEAAVMSATGVGITKGIVSFDLDNTSDIGEENSKLKTDETGVLLCGSYERKSKYGGIMVSYSYYTGKLTATEKDNVLDSVQLNEPMTKNYASILVNYDNGKFEIFANGGKTPLMTVKASVKDGGGVSLVCDGGKARFFNFSLQDTTNLSNAYESKVFKEWLSKKSNAVNVGSIKTRGKAFSTDFSDYKAWTENMYKLKRDVSDWRVEDGVLKAISNGANWSFATVTNGTFGDIDISVKVKFTDYAKDSYSSVNIAICKDKIYTGNTDSGYMLKVFGNGNVYLYDNSGPANMNGWNDSLSDLENFFTLRLVKKGNKISAFVNDKQIYSGTSSTYSSGFAAIGCDYACAEFDDLVIK